MNTPPSLLNGNYGILIRNLVMLMIMLMGSNIHGSEMIRGCVNKFTGDLRVLDYDQVCDNQLEYPISWNSAAESSSGVIKGKIYCPGTPAIVYIPDNPNVVISSGSFILKNIPFGVYTVIAESRSDPKHRAIYDSVAVNGDATELLVDLTNLSSDAKNCGTCGFECSTGQVCVEGICQDACPQNFLLCNGTCVDTMQDLDNCGFCDVACPVISNGYGTCDNGRCSIGSCYPGFADCNSSITDGCETDLISSTMNCGACGASCPAVANGSGVCKNGQCEIGFCSPGFADCNKSIADGCETNLNNSLYHCGVCGTSCADKPYTATNCNQGQCVITNCKVGYSDCDGLVSNGCETKKSNCIYQGFK